MVLKVWRDGDGPSHYDPAQYRAAVPEMRDSDLIWDALNGSDPLSAWMQRHGLLSGLVVLAGVTPSTGFDLDANVEIASAYLAAARRLGIARVLLASSSAVYGIGQGAPLNEDDPCHPNSFYGAYKLMMEDVASGYRKEGLEVCCLRIGNVVGADALPLGAHLDQLGEPLEIDCFEDGHGPLRSYLGPVSLAGILSQLAHHPARLPFLLNVAAPQPVHMDALADAAGLPWSAVPAAGYTPQRIVLDCTRLARLVNLRADAGAAPRLISEWRAYG